MNEAERELMISIAKALKAQGEAITSLQKKEETVPIRHITTPLPEFQVPQVTSTVQHSHNDRRFKVDVRFHGQEMMSDEIRMDESVKFARELKEVLEAYKVTHFNAHYD